MMIITVHIYNRVNAALAELIVLWTIHEKRRAKLVFRREWQDSLRVQWLLALQFPSLSIKDIEEFRSRSPSSLRTSGSATGGAL